MIPAFPVIFEDDFEGPLNWTAYGAGAVHATLGAAHSGTKSLQVTTAAKGGDRTAACAYGPYSPSAFRFSCWFYFNAADPLDHIWWQVTQSDGTRYVDFIVRYQPESGVWSYKSSDQPETFENFTVMRLGSLFWQYVEFAADFSNLKWNYARIGELKLPLDGRLGTTGTSTAPYQSQVLLQVGNVADASVSVEFDDLQLTSEDSA